MKEQLKVSNDINIQKDKQLNEERGKVKQLEITLEQTKRKLFNS